MTSVFWDSQGMIMIDYLEHSHTINGAYYAGEFRRLRPHPCPHVMTAATEDGFEILPHPPYSPHMAPFDFYLCSQD